MRAAYVDRMARLRGRMRDSGKRVVSSLPAILQIGLAASASYAITHFVLGHELPLFAVTVTISSLGFSRDARPIRVLETAAAMILGIGLADLLLLGIGRGWWQLFVVLVATLVVTRFVSAGPGFSVVAGIQAALVTLFPALSGNEPARIADGLVGGAVALAATALIPRDPRRIALADAERLFGIGADALAELSASLRLADPGGAADTLEGLRRTQPLVDAWSGSLESATAVARISPFLRGHRAELEAQRVLLQGMDLAFRNLRIIARRAEVLLRDGREQPELADLLGRTGAALTILGRSLREPRSAELARRDLAGVAIRLDPRTAVPDPTITQTMVLMLLRPLLVDLLVAAGADESEARAALPPIH